MLVASWPLETPPVPSGLEALFETLLLHIALIALIAHIV